VWALSDPAASAPVTSGFVSTNPASSNPTTSDSATSEPATSEPATTEPATSDTPVIEQKLDLSPATMPGSDSHPWREVRPLPAEYQILLTRSIFSKSPIAPDRDDMVGTGPTRLELDYVLRGIASQGGPLVAFIENSRKAQVLRLQSGDRIARGNLGAVSLDGVEYICKGKVTRIAIGCAFDGTAQEPLPPPSTQSVANGAEGSRRPHHKSKASAELQAPTALPSPPAPEPNPKAR